MSLRDEPMFRIRLRNEVDDKIVRGICFKRVLRKVRIPRSGKVEVVGV